MSRGSIKEVKSDHLDQLFKDDSFKFEFKFND